MTIQYASAAGWTVAARGSGVARYHCQMGSRGVNTYRLDDTDIRFVSSCL